MEKRIYEGLPTDLTTMGPTQYAEAMGFTRQMAHWLINRYEDGKDGLPQGVEKIEKIGNRRILYVNKQMLKLC